MKQQNTPYFIQDKLANFDVLEASLMPNVRKLSENERGVLYEYDNLYFLACEPEQAESFFPLITEGLTHDCGRLVVLRGANARNALEQVQGEQGGFEGVGAFGHVIVPVRCR